MLLLKAAFDAGAGAHAVLLLNTGRLDHDDDTSVDWPRSLLRLEALVRTLDAAERQSLARLTANSAFD
jgi:hypothetical protein